MAAPVGPMGTTKAAQAPMCSSIARFGRGIRREVVDAGQERGFAASHGGERELERAFADEVRRVRRLLADGRIPPRVQTFEGLCVAPPREHRDVGAEELRQSTERRRRDRGDRVDRRAQQVTRDVGRDQVDLDLSMAGGRSAVPVGHLSDEAQHLALAEGDHAGLEDACRLARPRRCSRRSVIVPVSRVRSTGHEPPRRQSGGNTSARFRPTAMACSIFWRSARRPGSGGSAGHGS